jgi:hypothetical protein
VTAAPVDDLARGADQVIRRGLQDGGRSPKRKRGELVMGVADMAGAARQV